MGRDRFRCGGCRCAGRLAAGFGEHELGSSRGGEDPGGFGPPAKKSNGDKVLCVRTSAIVLDRDIGDTSGRQLGALLQCDPKVRAHLPSGSTPR